MPRKGAKLSPAAMARQKAAENEWRKDHMANVTITVRKERRADYMALAAKRGKSLRALIMDWLDAECRAEGIGQ